MTDRFGGNRWPLLPTAALMMLVHHELHIFATSGLETIFATALVTLVFIFALTAERPKDFLLVGLINMLAIMTRPDMAIFWAAGLFYFILTVKRNRLNLLYYIIPLLAIYLPYWLIRYSYYGYPFPNSFYAKSGSGAYYSQGLSYLWLYVKTYYPLLLTAPAIIYALVKLSRAVFGKIGLTELHHRLWLLSLLYIIPYCLYVVRVGGDFMFARFLIPVTPICLIFLESVLNKIRIGNRLRFAIAILLIVTILVRWPQFDPPTAELSGIVDEHAAYPTELIDDAKTEGAKLKKYLGGLDVSSAFYGKKAMLVFYSEIYNSQEAAASLTDEFIAHRPIQKRGRPGHEKRMPYNYLIEKKINFVLGGTFRSSEDTNQPEVISFDGVIAHIVIYENQIMEYLKSYPEVKFLHFPEFLDRYIMTADSIPRRDLAGDIQFFRSYYFDHNNDPERLRVLMNRLYE